LCKNEIERNINKKLRNLNKCMQVSGAKIHCMIKKLSSGVTREGRKPLIRSARFPSQRRDRCKSKISRVVEENYGIEEEEEQNEITSSGNYRKLLKEDLKSNNKSIIRYRGTFLL
jgi:hypothetical protein